MKREQMAAVLTACENVELSFDPGSRGRKRLLQMILRSVKNAS